MAQSGYTPISLYFSATGAAVPTAGNLVAGELALNTADGKLYFKNSSGVVTLLAGSTSGPAGGSTTQVQYNNAGVLAGITGATSNGTALTLVAPNLGSPTSVGTMPAFTLGGTVSGGGNQINNVVIGNSSPLAGAFTTVSASSTISAGANISTINGAGYLWDAGAVQIYSNGTYMRFRTGSTDRLELTNAGLAVTGTLSATGAASLVTTTVIGAAGTAAGETALTVGDATNATFRMAFTNGPLIQLATNTSVTMAFGAKESSSGAFTQWAALSSTGLAVTGTLSSTLDATIQGLTVGRGAGAVVSNTVVGAGALATNSTGVANSALGSGSLAITTASYNTALGFQSGFKNTSGTRNTFLGVYTGFEVSTGQSNTYVGYTSGPNGIASTGSYNTAVGDSSLFSNTSASNNTAVGYQALYTNATLPEQTAVGYQAGFYSTGGYNTFIGHGSGKNQSTGDSNTYVGRGITGNAAVGASTGSNNTAMGNFALSRLTSGANNVAIGAASLQANTTGTTNIAVGVNALYANTVGLYNVAVGHEAGYSLGANAAGNGNTAMGHQALFYAQTASASNTAVGFQALQSTSGNNFNNSTAVGAEALKINTSASNTALGYRAGYINTSGTNNVFVGIESGVNNTTGSGNTFVGRTSGLLSTGSYNCFVGQSQSSGYSSGYEMTTGSKNTILGGFSGNQGSLDIRTASNYIVLSDGDGNPYIQGQWAGAPVLAQSAISTITSGSAQVIYTMLGSAASALVLVTGRDSGGNWFNDILNIMQSNSAQTISTQNGGGPGSRTYSMNVTQLLLNPSVTQVIVRVVVIQNINA